MAPALPLLNTKLTRPPLAGGLVLRGRLFARLNETRPLTILSAPPGFGKTTLLIAWLQQLTTTVDHPPAISWLSLDEDDNDPVRFWWYVIAALQIDAPDLGVDALAALQSSPTLNVTTVITLLINDLAAQPHPRVLVLDDYQAIAQQSIHMSLQFLLDHLPANLRIILATRADPPWPLARWRARSQLIEIGQADLRFTPAESAEFLNELMDLRLTADDVAALEQHTEGWIAGLQLAALSMRDRTDRTEFIRSLSGTHTYIADYFIEEILNHQTEAIQTFLMQTSVLDQLCAPLCNAVTDRSDSQTLLEQLYHTNLFIQPLDQERAWYRYHPLFGDLLRARLQQTRAAEMLRLHQRAAEWYEQQHFISEAIDHVLAAGDFDHAADLIEQAAPDRLLRGEAYGLLQWLAALPISALKQHTLLLVLQALALMSVGELTAALAQLDRVDESTLGLEERAVAAAVRSGAANLQGDILRATEFARQGFALIEQAHADHEAASNYVPVIMLLLASALADAQARRGQLAEAIATLQRALRLNTAETLPALWSALAALQTVQLGRWRCEQNDLGAAERDVQQGLELSREIHNTEAEAYGWLALAHIRQAQGHRVEADQHIRRAVELIRQRNVSLEIAHVMVQAARLWLQQGKLDEVRAWAAQVTDKPPAVLTPTEMSEAIMKTRLQLAEGQVGEASTRLKQLASVAQANDQIDALIDMLIGQAVIAWLSGHGPAAYEALQGALAYAEPGGYVRRFVDEGAPLQALLPKFLEARRHGHLPAEPRVSLNYLSRLLAAFEATPSSPALIEAAVEPLSDREVEILRLIAANRSNQEIAQELVLSVSTVKWHITNLFGKLQARNRLEAVNRARELNLL
jgi:LuxR family maltose regulon positive regulatory protein